MEDYKVNRINGSDYMKRSNASYDEDEEIEEDAYEKVVRE